MPTLIQNLYKEITIELGNLKTSKDEDQVIIINLLKKIHCLSYIVINMNIDVGFPNKVEGIKQYRQSVIYSENVHFIQICNTKVSEIKDNDNGCSL